MANICNTSVRISGHLSALRKAIEEALFPNGVSNEWLGNFLIKTGMTEDEVYDSGIDCKGEVWYYEGDDTEIQLEISSAGYPMMDPVMMLCDKYATDATVTYRSIEPGAEIYLTNDSNYEKTYYCESFEDSIEMYDFFTRDELKEKVESILSKKAGLNSLLKEFTAKYDVNIHKMEFCEIDDL
jgi:hypothetical protein